MKKIYSSEKNYKTVSQIQTHPNFTFGSSLIDGERSNFPKNDIALFKLSSPFKLGDETNLFATCISSKEINDFKEDLVIASYGLVYNSTFFISEKSRNINKRSKKEINLFIDQPNLFATKLKQGNDDDYKHYNFTKDQMIIASSPASNVCEGNI